MLITTEYYYAHLLKPLLKFLQALRFHDGQQKILEQLVAYCKSCLNMAIQFPEVLQTFPQRLSSWHTCWSQWCSAQTRAHTSSLDPEIDLLLRGVWHTVATERHFRTEGDTLGIYCIIVCITYTFVVASNAGRSLGCGPDPVAQTWCTSCHQGHPMAATATYHTIYYTVATPRGCLTICSFGSFSSSILSFLLREQSHKLYRGTRGSVHHR